MLFILKRCWQLLIILLTPFILLPLPLLIDSNQARCAYIVLLLTVYWVSEAMPYAVASLLPLALFPMLNVLPGDEIGHNYFKDITTLFLGSMTLAHAMEHVHLHRRLALFVLSFVGSSIKWSMAGLMCVTAFLSMWINNSAATSIMIPAAIAIVDELENYEEKLFSNEEQSHEIVPIDTETVFDLKTIVEESNDQKQISGYTEEHTDDEIIPFKSPVRKKFKANFDYHKLKSGMYSVLIERMRLVNVIPFEGFLIAVAYSAALGGLTTLVGTGPNIFVKGFIDQMYENNKNFTFEISFGNFILYALPIGLIMLIFCWLWLQILYNRHEFFRWKIDAKEQEREKHLQAILKQQYNDLNSLSWQEIIIIFLFIILITLWIIRDFSADHLLFIFDKEYTTDGTIALFIGSLPLVLPDKNPFQSNWQYQPILPWNHLSKTFPWGVFMLQGAGLAIADGFKASDLSSTMATFLRFIIGAPKLVVILFVIITSALFTELTSNLACASILFPILNSIAIVAKIHPAHLIMPSCMAVSLSFMLPIATPPNAMILLHSNVRPADLIKAGIGLKLFGILAIFILSTTLLTSIFQIDELQTMFNTTILVNNSLN